MTHLANIRASAGKLLVGASLIGFSMLPGCAQGAFGGALSPAVPVEAPGQTAYDVAGQIQLPEREAEDQPGLHHIYRLSDSIISGAEPEGRKALVALKEMGIRTILSVDGKVPEGDAAAELGMRYVHMPIRYSGLTDEELLAIAKTFRELEGPFYVHCFHGKHRGPAAAAVGRVLIDGASREQAVAEMRQWCGTSQKYEGLYAEIAFGDLPTAADTEAFVYDFAPRRTFGGIRPAMVDLTRSWDVIKDLKKRDWQINPNHPDANARNEAAKIADMFVGMKKLEEVSAQPDDFQGWIEDSERLARQLTEQLKAAEQGDTEMAELAKGTATKLGKTCSACHTAYRN